MYDLIKNTDMNVSILFGGDLNAYPNSSALEYILTGSIPFKRLSDGILIFQSFNQIINFISCIDECNLLKKQQYNLAHSLHLKTNCQHFKYTHYLPTFNSVLDYVIYDNFTIKRVIPLPTHEQVTQTVALPSRILPSDHLAIIFEFEWKLS